MGSIDSRGRGGSRYRAGGGPGAGAGGAVNAFGGEFAPGYSGDSGNLYREALKANRAMPGRGSDPDLLDSHIGKLSRDPSSRNRNFADALTGKGRRRTSMDITGVFSNIQASLGKAFHGSSSKYDSKNMMWDSININFEANIAPRRPSDSDDEFADYIDRQIANDYASGPSWMESASERIVDGFGRAGYVLGDCCDSTTRAARNNRRTLLLVAAAAIIAVIGTMSVNAYQENHNGSRFPSSSSSSSGTIRSPPSTTSKDKASSEATHTVTTTPQVINVPSSSKDTAKKGDAPRTSFGTVVDTFDESSRYGIIRQRILESGLSKASDLDNISANPSPQHKALKWIADMDGAALDPQHHGLLQRYSLAVLFFSTFLSSELPDLESLKKMGHLQPVTQLGEGWKDRTNWLTDKGHCLWHGVQCHHRDGTSPTLTVYNGNEGITVLNLTANNLEGTLPAEIQGLGDLRTLDLGDNLIEGTLPAALGHISELELLLLDGNGFDGTIPKTLGYLENAQHIYLNNNYLVGKIPEELSDMIKLSILSLYRNQLTGTLPHFEGLVNLRDLYVDGNNLSGEIPHSLANLRNLVDLRIGNNELTGTIPLKMCEMEKLQTLYLEENFLGGTIPDCIDIMSSLVEIQLFNNGIGGSIPESIGDLQNLELLYIDGNEISGPLPSSIGKLAKLKSFYAHDNNLTGQIPQDVSKLGNLQRLYLHQNELEGPVPSELGALTRVEEIRLHQNNLSGKVPSDVCMLKDHSLVDLQGDCGTSGKIQCECCTECH